MSSSPRRIEAGMTRNAEWTWLLTATVGVTALAVPLVAGVLAAPRLRAQAPAAQAPTAPADRPAFDVASVKANKSGDNRVLLRVQPGGLYTATNVTLKDLLTAAYQLKPQQISGLPNWGDSDHFDVEAKAADGSTARDQINLMV